MNKIKILAIAGSTIVGFSLLTTSAFAIGNHSWQNWQAKNPARYQQMLSNKAAALGLSVAQLQSKLKTESFAQILKDQGLTLAQFRQKMHDALVTRLKAKGLTDSQIAAYFQQHHGHRFGFHKHLRTK